MSMINAANSTSGSSVSCSYCSRDNHIVENFFKKHGYPTNFSNNRGGRASTCGSLAEGVLQAEAISIMVKYVPTAISLVTLLNSVIGNMATLLAIDSTNHKELQLII